MEHPNLPARLILAMTGTTGSIFGVRILQLLQATEWETHLIVSKWGLRTLSHETPYGIEEVRRMANVYHPVDDQGATISSGSFITRGMIIAPCSMRTLSAVAHGHSENLIHRAADVVLKERRKLVLVVRESPLNDIHLENMLKLSRMGVVIVPPVPAFYNHPRTLDDVIDQVAMRVLDHFGVHMDVAGRWTGKMSTGGASLPGRQRRSRP